MLSSTPSKSVYKIFSSFARIVAICGAVLIAGSSNASACEIGLVDGKGRFGAVAPAELPEKIVSATLRCGDDRRSVTVWTLGVDNAAEYLGVRDAPLFRTEFTGPLRQIAVAEIPGAASVSVHARVSALEGVFQAGGPAPSFRRFATFCDTAHQSFAPLNCSLNGARVKARATAHDADHDGALDVVKHEVSLYFGGDRLHVVSFMEAYRPSALDGASVWIDVLNGFEALAPGV